MHSEWQRERKKGSLRAAAVAARALPAECRGHKLNQPVAASASLAANSLEPHTASPRPTPRQLIDAPRQQIDCFPYIFVSCREQRNIYKSERRNIFAKAFRPDRKRQRQVEDLHSAPV
jgi:hypothetical protein